ncbi:MAG: DEAD/DEAH box helicase [Treponema sp.]|jgi:ATP-dependent RNA helicase RhlB|nr:DEAD/DEAH box helicase [Treponema sp.]
MEFKELNLHPDLQRGIADAEYTVCTSVQEQVLANAFGGQDLYVQSQTGTGKTAAFLIVIFQRLLNEPLLKGKKAIIMVPTRELAIQVEEEARVLGKYLPFKVGSFYGGVGYTTQQQLLKDNVQILVGTPGRVLDLNQSGQMNLMDIAFLVLDEADRMFDMGFYPNLRKLIKVVPPADRRQTMLFSATLNAWVRNLAWEYTKSPYEIEITPEIVTLDEVDQILYHVSTKDKMKLLLGIFRREQPESAIIFCNTKRQTEIVAKRLQVNGFTCEFIIGDLPQSKRFKIIDDIKAGQVKYLVATDVAARGLDIDGLALVVNYDLPVEAENYVHRIGRTARAGKTGRAIALVSEQDVYELADIEKYIGKKIPAEIAGEGLYAQDTSEGMRIYTDFMERMERVERRATEKSVPENRRGGRRPRQQEGRQTAERGTHRVKEGSQDRRPWKQGVTYKPTGPVLKKLQDPDYQDLSHLTFEERMSYYKQKYETRSPSAKTKSPPREAGLPRENGDSPKRRRSRLRTDKQGKVSHGRRGEGLRTEGPGEARPDQSLNRPAQVPTSKVLPRSQAGAAKPQETADPAIAKIEKVEQIEKIEKIENGVKAGKEGFLARLFSSLFSKKSPVSKRSPDL